MQGKLRYIAIDVGGSWLKGVSVAYMPGSDLKSVYGKVLQTPVVKVKSRLGEGATVEDFMLAIDDLLSLLDEGEPVAYVGVSTAGLVDYKGSKVAFASGHLKALENDLWIKRLGEKVGAPVVLINDADAAAIGAAAAGYLNGFRTIGVMPVGTGVGFSLWRNGRRWNPHQTTPLLGSVRTPEGSYDQVAGMAAIGLQSGEDILRFFSDPAYAARRSFYEKNLANAIYTACILYHTDQILIGGGLAEAVTEADYDLADHLQEILQPLLANLGKQADIQIMPEGNALPLIGAFLLAIGEHVAHTGKPQLPYHRIGTETAYDEALELHRMSSKDLVYLLWKAEDEAGGKLQASLGDIAEVAEKIADAFRRGGRLIYVGAGTSGRLAAIDTVELACTFGFPRECVYTLIAGGLADAAIDIETNFEEDASSVPELLLTGINERDAVVGISASGSAYYVQSALALAKSYGAYCVLIQENHSSDAGFCDKIISLHSGREVIAGSTRMKAGTATKKILNFLSTTAMILSGKVYGCYMVEVECINQKLISRAQGILNRLFGIGEQDALELLRKNQFNLHQAIDQIRGTG